MLATLTEELDKLAAGACWLGPADEPNRLPTMSMITLQPRVLTCMCDPCHLGCDIPFKTKQSAADARAPKLLLSPPMLHGAHLGATGFGPNCSPPTCSTPELDETPREHSAVLLLGEVAAYLSDWHPPCLGAARRFAAMTSRAADDLVCDARLVGAALLAYVHMGRLLHSLPPCLPGTCLPGVLHGAMLPAGHA